MWYNHHRYTVTAVTTNCRVYRALKGASMSSLNACALSHCSGQKGFLAAPNFYSRYSLYLGHSSPKYSQESFFTSLGQYRCHFQRNALAHYSIENCTLFIGIFPFALLSLSTTQQWKGTKSWHTQQRGWNLRALYWTIKNKPISKNYILHDSIYIPFLTWQNYRNGKQGLPRN